MGVTRVLTDWWRAQTTAKDLHERLQRTPPGSAWRLPCDTSKPDDVIVARAVQLLQQKYPGHYRVIWGSKSLSIYHTDAFKASISDRSASTLARWGLLVPPRSDTKGIHSPPSSAGGKAFEGERTSEEPSGGTGPEVEIVGEE